MAAILPVEVLVVLRVVSCAEKTKARLQLRSLHRTSLRNTLPSLRRGVLAGRAGKENKRLGIYIVGEGKSSEKFPECVCCRWVNEL
jgi:hypothetical protein